MLVAAPAASVDAPLRELRARRLLLTALVQGEQRLAQRVPDGLRRLGIEAQGDRAKVQRERIAVAAALDVQGARVGQGFEGAASPGGGEVGAHGAKSLFDNE